jgi:hypothetical protein
MNRVAVSWGKNRKLRQQIKLEVRPTLEASNKSAQNRLTVNAYIKFRQLAM